MYAKCSDRCHDALTVYTPRLNVYWTELGGDAPRYYQSSLVIGEL